jgi:hypothetical protein
MEYYEIHDAEIREAEANIALANEQIVGGDMCGVAIRLRALDELLDYEQDVPRVTPFEIARLTRLSINRVQAAIDSGDLARNSVGMVTYGEAARWYEANYLAKLSPSPIAIVR